MSESKEASATCLVFVIMVMISLLSLPLLFTNSALSKAQPESTASASSKYPLPLISHSWTNSSTANASTLTGSALSITKSMRNLNETVPEPGERPYIAENNSYVFSQNKSEISTPNNNSHTGEFGKGVKIAVVMPTFTAAAYTNAFYIFYNKYINVTREVNIINITTDLNLLSSKVTNDPSSSASGPAMLYLLGNLKWITPDSNVAFETDQDVDAGSIFQANGSNAYDVIILGHQEYVTQKEYNNLKQFVGDGGTMILVDGNVFMPSQTR